MQSLALPPLQEAQLEWQLDVSTVTQSVVKGPMQSRQESQQ